MYLCSLRESYDVEVHQGPAGVEDVRGLEIGLGVSDRTASVIRILADVALPAAWQPPVSAQEGIWSKIKPGSAAAPSAGSLCIATSRSATEEALCITGYHLGPAGQSFRQLRLYFARVFQDSDPLKSNAV